MFGLFKKKTELESLDLKYKKLLKEAYTLSKTDRRASDSKMAEAEEILRKIASIQNNSV